MRFILVKIIWIKSQSTSQCLLARTFSWIPDMIPYIYSIAGVLLRRYLNECIRYANRVEKGVRRRFSLILQWICASQRYCTPFCLFFVQVMHFWISYLVISVCLQYHYPLPWIPPEQKQEQYQGNCLSQYRFKSYEKCAMDTIKTNVG